MQQQQQHAIVPANFCLSFKKNKKGVHSTQNNGTSRRRRPLKTVPPLNWQGTQQYPPSMHMHKVSAGTLLTVEGALQTAAMSVFATNQI